MAGKRGVERKGVSGVDPGTVNRWLIVFVEDNRAPLFLHSTHLYRLLTPCQGLCPGDTGLSSLVTYTSLLNISISPCLLGAPRELTGVSSGLPEFCRKDKMLLLSLGSVSGNEQSHIVTQVPR